MIIQSQAIVLKSFSYSDTSIISRCFTREMGKISVIVHGAKKKNQQKSAYFQPASYVDLVFYFKETREIQTVSKASFVQTWPHLQNDLKKIAYVLSVIELTDKTVIDRDPHKDLFDELVNVIRLFGPANGLGRVRPEKLLFSKSGLKPRRDNNLNSKCQNTRLSLSSLLSNSRITFTSSSNKSLCGSRSITVLSVSSITEST